MQAMSVSQLFEHISDGNYIILNFNYSIHSNVAKAKVELGLTSHQIHRRSCRGRVFVGQMTQQTVSKHCREIGSDPKD